MTNVLSKKRLEAARLYMSRYDPYPAGHDEADTVRAAIGFLINPELTHSMEKAAAEAYIPQPDAPEVPIFDILDCQPNLNYRIIRTIFNAAISTLTKDDE